MPATTGTQRSARSAGYPTTADAVHPGDRRVERGRYARRAFTVVLVAFVAAAAAGAFGLRTRSVEASRGDVSARLRYAAVSRRGVTSAWELVVRRDGGFAGDVHVRVSSRYLDTLDLRGIVPEPASSSSDGTTTEYVFARPRAATLAVRIDGDIDADASPGRHRGTVTVHTADASPLTIRFLTWVWP